MKHKGKDFSEGMPTELSVEAQKIFMEFVATHDMEQVEELLDETLLDINNHQQWHQPSYFMLYKCKKIMRQMQKTTLQPHKPLCPTVQEMLMEWFRDHLLHDLVWGFDETLRNIFRTSFDCTYESYDVIFDLKKMIEKWQRINLFPDAFIYSNAQHKLLKATDLCDSHFFQEKTEQAFILAK